MPRQASEGDDGLVSPESQNTPVMTPAYRWIVAASTPLMLTWCRLRVSGADCLPTAGPVLLVADHDSYWDPIAIAVAARHRREIRALSKSTLWKTRLGAALMDGMGHIPVTRGASNEQALAAAVAELGRGACIGVFPEGTRSLGRRLRARSGIGRLARAVPEAVVVCARVNGSTDVVRIPHRPRIEVQFFHPRGGQIGPEESPAAFAERLVGELREHAPREIPGRRRTAAKHRARLAG